MIGNTFQTDYVCSMSSRFTNRFKRLLRKVTENSVNEKVITEVHKVQKIMRQKLIQRDGEGKKVSWAFSKILQVQRFSPSYHKPKNSKLILWQIHSKKHDLFLIDKNYLTMCYPHLVAITSHKIFSIYNKSSVSFLISSSYNITTFVYFLSFMSQICTQNRYPIKIYTKAGVLLS